MQTTDAHVNTEVNNYNEYRMSKPEKFFTAFVAMLTVGAAAYLFYQNLFISAAASPLGLIYLPYRRRRQIERRRDALKSQFRDMLYSLSSSLMAGKTMEAALREVRADLEIIYPDPHTAIIRETDVMIRKINLNETVETAFRDLAARSGVDDIENFCGVLATCRLMGGNLVEIVKNTTNILGDKMEIKNEIDVLLAQRRFEKRILNAMPIALIFTLSITAKDYIAPVYATLAGKAVMTVALMLIAASWFISGKIMRIDV